MELQRRRVLAFSPIRESFVELCDSVRSQQWITGDPGDDGCVWEGPQLRLDIDVVDRLEDTVRLLHSGYYNLLLIDCRHHGWAEANPVVQEQATHSLLDILENERDPERRYPKRRVVVLVGDEDEERVDRLIFEMGERHVGGCFRDLSLSPRLVNDHAEEYRTAFIERLWEHCKRVLVQRRKGRRAISAAGGGITGIYYELGVLKCLNDAIVGDLRDFDLFMGISGGAGISSCLANGISVDEMISKVGAMDRTWKYRLKLSWRNLNVMEVPRRVLLVQQELMRYMMRMVKREDDLSIASMMGVAAVLLGPVFDNAQFERALRNLFVEQGRGNDFRELPCELWVGATDQDRREHVLFGRPGMDHIPISQAVQASAAMHPFFPSVKIDGRYYTDGIVTRTSNVREAINGGADLVFVIDPFVPLISDEPGLNARHGNMWIVEQDYKTLAYTRFEQARDELIRSNPHVNIYTFVPSNRMRELMSNQNPFVAKNFHPIVCEAYRSTWRRLRQIRYKISGELSNHGLQFDLAPVEEKVKALRAAKRPNVKLLLDDTSKAEVA